MPHRQWIAVRRAAFALALILGAVGFSSTASAALCATGTCSIENTAAGDGIPGWLESAAMTGETKNDSEGDNGHRARITLVVKHPIGVSVSKLRIDQNWDDSDNTGGNPTTGEGDALYGATNFGAETGPTLPGGFEYTRVSYAWNIRTSGTGLSNGVFSGTRRTNKRFYVAAELSSGAWTPAQQAQINFTSAGNDSYGREDFPYLYSQRQNATDVAPGATVTFEFKGDDPDTTGDTDDFGGIRYRLRRLGDGRIEAADGTVGGKTTVCYGGGQDNQRKSLPVTFAKRGRWVVEAEVGNGDGSTCTFDGSANNPGRWFRIGQVNVNSAAGPSGTITLAGVPTDGQGRKRPTTGATVSANLVTSDPDDAEGGRTQVVEWDLDRDTGNGFEIVNRGTPTDGISSDSRTFTVGGTPGSTYKVRARLTDNGNLNAADNQRRQNTVEAAYLVNTVPTAAGVSETTDAGTAKAVTLSGSDADGDALTYAIASGPSHGTLSGSGASRTYTPDAGFAGTDTFTYTASDAYGGTSTAGTVTISVRPTAAITGGIAQFATSTSTSVPLEFTSQSGAAFECRIDGFGAWTACASGDTFGPFATGPHWIEVRATLGALTQATAADSVLFIVDPSGQRVCGPQSTETPGTVTGTAGPDVICVNGGDFTVDAGGSDDIVYAGTGNDTIEGGTGGDQLYGGPGTDALSGGSDAGVDRMDGGAQADTFAGGPGIDRVLYDTRTAGVTVTIGSGADDGQAGEGDDIGADVESVTGGEGTDSLTGNGQSNTFSGRGGDDVIDGGDADDFMGGAKNGNHTFHGGDGVDRVTYTHYGAGDPVHVTVDGVADDGASGESDNVGTDIEYVYGSQGDDELSAEGNDTGISFWGYAGNDTLIGSEASDALYGMEGNDTLEGRGGADILRGDAGNDTLRGGAGSDELSCGDDVDTFELDLADTFNPLPAGNCENPLG